METTATDSTLTRRQMVPSVDPRPQAWPTYWAALLAFFLFLQSVALAVSIPRGNPPDEIAHIAYVADATHSRAFMPDYANGEILDSGKKNYLGHPPLYYSALAVVCQVFGLDPLQNYKILRIVSGMFVALGFFLWLLAARNFGTGLQGATLLTLACCAIPMFGYLSGSINNDTLVYLGVGACFFGLSRFKLDPLSTDGPGVFLFAAGLVIALLTKATAAAFLTFFLCALLVLRWRDVPAYLRNHLYLKAAAAIVLICGSYFLYAMIRFGSPMPKPAALYEVSPPAHPVSIIQFALKYANSMWDRLPVVMSHASISPIPDRVTAFFYTMMLLPVLGWIVSRSRALSRGASRAELWMGDAFVFALLCTIAINIYVTYAGYLRTGLYAGWQPRYLFFVIPGVWLLMSMTRPPAGLQATVTAAFGTCLCITFWASVPFLLAKRLLPVVQTPIETTVVRRATVGIEPALSIDIGRSASTATGHLDEIRLEKRKLFLRGWSFDAAASIPTRRIWILAGDTYLGSTSATSERPDVAKALNAPSALKTGFAISIQDVPKELQPCDIKLLAELSDGNLALLRDQKCQPTAGR